MIASFLEALAALLALGALVALFLWMVSDAIGLIPDARDRVRPYTRDV